MTNKIKNFKKLNYKKVVGRNISKKDAEKMVECIEEQKGSIPAYLELILHNQVVLNRKLRKLLERK